MPNSTDLRLLAPKAFPSHAYKQESEIRNDNNSEKTREDLWLEAARLQRAEISASQADFLTELRRRTRQ